MTPTPPASPTGRLPGLDMLRGLAIALVLLRHAWPDTFGGAGIVGVVVFFGLSGYLITGVLLSDIRRYGRVRYGRFYRNRLLRLYPPLLLLVVGYVLVTVTWNPFGESGQIPRTVLVALTYTADLPGFDHGSGVLSHLWTLAIEEQFYIVWPILLLLATRWNRIGAMLMASAFGIYVLCVGTLWAADDVASVYTLPTSWAVVMVIGAAARVYQERVEGWLSRSSGALAVLALAVLLGLAFMPEAKEWWGSYLLLGPLVGACTVVLIFHVRSWTEAPTSRLGRGALWLGTISYACYLWNLPVAAWFESGFGDSILVSACTLPATLMLAQFSWIAVEGPVANWRRHRELARETA